jgi:hypothetical protein
MWSRPSVRGYRGLFIALRQNYAKGNNDTARTEYGLIELDVSE